MKRILALGCSIALAAMLLAGCGNGGNNEQPSGGEGTGIAVEDVKVGVIHIGDPATGSGYSYTHDQGIVAMQETLGLSDDQIVRKNNIDDGDTTAIENAMNECIEEGCNIIFATSWAIWTPARRWQRSIPTCSSPMPLATSPTRPTSTTISAALIRPGICPASWPA